MNNADTTAAGEFEDRILQAEQIFITYPRIKKIRERIARCHMKSSRSQEPRCFMVTGESGCGKTSLAKAYRRKYPPVETENGTTIPVLYSLISAPATVKGVTAGLLASMGEPFPGHGTITTMTPKLDTLLANCGVQLIILDEFQHLIDKDSKRVLFNTADWLKNLIDRTGIPVVLMGLPESYQILKDHKQLRRRFSAHVNLEPFGFESDAEINEFRIFLKMVDDHLPLSQRSNLYEFYTALRFFLASDGFIWKVMQIVKAAVEYAFEARQESLSLAILEKAYEEEIGSFDDAKQNPFSMDASDLITPDKEEPDPSSGSPKDGGKNTGENISQVLHT
jgi:hypothetical protein